MERIPFLIAQYPRRAIVAGKALLLAGSIMILAAVFGRAGLISVNEERAKANLPPIRKLAEAFPEYPTWLVPETTLGFGLAAFLVVAGMTLHAFGEKAARR